MENKNAEIGYESATAAVVKIIFEESGVSDVVVNSRILNVFKKKISVLQTGGLKTCERGRSKNTGKVVEWMENRTEISVRNLLQCEILRGQIKNHSHATHLYLR